MDPDFYSSEVKLPLCQSSKGGREKKQKINPQEE